MVHAFIFGPLAITVRYWEEHDEEVEGGARIELRRVEPVIGEKDRPGAAGWRVGAISQAAIWRCDLLTVISRPGNEVRYHHHPQFEDGDVGPRVFDPGLTADPIEWTIGRLADLPALLTRAGAADLIGQVDLTAVEASLPVIRAATRSCLEQMPLVPPLAAPLAPPAQVFAA